MRLLMFIAMTVGGAIGWWLGEYVNIWVALLASGAGSIAGVYLAYRLARDYL